MRKRKMERRKRKQGKSENTNREAGGDEKEI